MKGYIINILFQMARYTSGKQGVIPRYDIASILVFNERIYEYGDKVKLVSVIYAVIRLKKCRVIGMIRWKKCD